MRLHTFLAAVPLPFFNIVYVWGDPMPVAQSEVQVRVDLPKRTFLQGEPIYDEAAKILDSMAENCTTSVYHILAFAQKMKLYDWSQSKREQEEAYETGLRLIDTYPESEPASEALTQMVTRMDKVIATAKQRTELFERILHMHPDSRIGRRAKHALDAAR